MPFDACLEQLFIPGTLRVDHISFVEAQKGARGVLPFFDSNGTLPPVIPRSDIYQRFLSGSIGFQNTVGRYIKQSSSKSANRPGSVVAERLPAITAVDDLPNVLSSCVVAMGLSWRDPFRLVEYPLRLCRVVLAKLPRLCYEAIGPPAFGTQQFSNVQYVPLLLPSRRTKSKNGL